MKTLSRRNPLRSVRLTRTAKPKRSPYLKDGTLKEAFIQAAILRWLESTGLLHWRQNSGTTFIKGRKVSLGPNGAPDIVVIVPTHGLFCGLEVKSVNGKQRPDQVQFAKGLTKMGGKYFIVRSVEDAKNAVAECLGETEWNNQ